MIKVSVTEALRIQKEIATTVQAVMRKSTYGLSYGINKEDGVCTDGGNLEIFPEFINSLTHIFSISQTINRILAEFSVKHNISDKVRERENLKFLQGVYENALTAYPPETMTRFEIVGNERKKVTSTFEPFISKKDLKEKVKEIKMKIRNIQAEIDVLNSQIIELPFDYEDIEVSKEE